MILNHKNDNRYTSKSYVCSHDKESLTAIPVTELNSILFTSEFKDCKAIFIDEAQFFNDLYDFVTEALTYDKWVVVCGLDGDFERKPFGQILDLIPLCDSICKLSAMCTKCNDGTKAIFSQRIVENTDIIMVGSNHEYEPVCRKHYNLVDKFKIY
jgi:thymidine kinase